MGRGGGKLSRQMKRKPPGFLCVMLLAAASGCQMLQSALSQAQKPSARVVGVALSDISVQSATLQFNVEIENPYDVPLPLANVRYSLASGDKPLLTGAANLQGTIPQ